MQAVIGIDPHKHVLTAIALDVRGGRARPVDRRHHAPRDPRAPGVGDAGRPPGGLGDRRQQLPGSAPRSGPRGCRGRRAGRLPSAHVGAAAPAAESG